MTPSQSKIKVSTWFTKLAIVSLSAKGMFANRVASPVDISLAGIAKSFTLNTGEFEMPVTSLTSKLEPRAENKLLRFLDSLWITPGILERRSGFFGKKKKIDEKGKMPF